MRVLAVLVLSSAVLAPGLGAADPAQPEPTTTMQPAPAAPSATAAASAQSAQAPAAAAAPTASADAGVNLDEIVCHSEPPPTGSRLGATRECHTVRQWNEREKEAQSIVGGSQMRGLAAPAGPPAK
jgi:hypothetical protein